MGGLYYPPWIPSKVTGITLIDGAGRERLLEDFFSSQGRGPSRDYWFYEPIFFLFMSLRAYCGLGFNAYRSKASLYSSLFLFFLLED